MGAPATRSASRFTRWKDSSPRGSLGAFADIVGLVTAVVTAASLVITSGFVAGVMAVVLGLLAIASVLLVWRLEWILLERETAAREREGAARHRERAAAATPGLAGSIGDLSRATIALTSGGEGSARAFVHHCEAACREFSRALQALTGASCRVTLQEVYVPTSGPDEDLAVKAIASSYGMTNRSLGAARVDLVRENTDFLRLFELEDFYLANNLPDEIASGYKNSHWPPEKLAEWRRTGDYPYKATAVWPLRGVVDGPGPDESKVEIVGFLSVDSPDAGIFDRDTVKPLGEAFAHAAYSGLVLYRVWSEEELWRD
jgi:hypothetical protein